MVLKVEFKQFAEEAKSRVGQTVYLSEQPRGCIATAGDPTKDLIVVATAEKSLADARIELENAGLKVSIGLWGAALEFPTGNESQPTYIAAVAYRSAEAKPGLWVDAFVTAPTPQEVLQRLFDEFRQQGEIAEASMEDFLNLASPNVVVVSPDEVRFFLEQKSSNQP